MPYLRREDKEQARRDQRAAEDSEVCAGYAAAAAAVAFVSLGASVLAPFAAVAALIAAASRYEAHRSRRIADDPLDPDYRRPARTSKRPFDPEAFGATRIDRSGVRFAETAFLVGGGLRAFIVSIERAWGARVADDRSTERTRLREATRHAARTADTLLMAADDALALGESVEALEARFSPIEAWRPGLAIGRPLSEALPDEAMATLYRAKIRVQELSVVVPDRDGDPLLPLSAALSELATARRKLAGGLESWTPMDWRDGPSSEGGIDV
jgi:hypothetical protein